MIINPVVSGIQLPDLTTPAGSEQILSGYQAINEDGEILTGTIASRGAQTITPGTSNQTIAAGEYLSGTQTIAGDSDLVAGNIKSGVNIFGVTGNYSGVEPVYGILQADEITITQPTRYSKRFTFNLPSNIKQILGLTVYMAEYIEGEAQYCLCSAPSSAAYPMKGDTLEEDTTRLKASLITPAYYAGNIDIAGGNVSLVINGRRVYFEVSSGDDEEMDCRGAAYCYLPA